MTDRSAVSSISFYSDNRTIDGAEMYDVSEKQDGSIKMYIKPNSESSSLYDISIVADGIISFPKILLLFWILSIYSMWSCRYI